MPRTGSLVLALLAPVLALADDPRKSTGPHAVEVLTFDWKDATRDRAVPAKVYLPSGAGPFPVVVFSHGLGGSRDGYEYLGRHWAGHGYVSVHLQHAGSDEAVWKGQANPMAALKKAVGDPKNATNRPKDVTFALDELERLNKADSPLKGKLDLGKVGVAGHSFGSFTTLASAGQVFPMAGQNPTLGDKRIKAAVPISPNAPANRADPGRSFGSIAVPTLHITGTKDTSPVDPNVKPADRRVPFDHCEKSERYLLIFDGADHIVFAQKPRAASAANDERVQALTRAATTAFWNAYLKGDAAAKEWLRGGLGKELGPADVLEMKPAAK